MFNLITRFRNWLFDRRYIEFNSLDKIYDSIKSGTLFYVRDHEDKCYKFIRIWNRIGVYQRLTFENVSNYYYYGVLTSEDKANDDELTVTDLDKGETISFKIKRISDKPEDCCDASKKIPVEPETLSKMEHLLSIIGRDHVNTSRDVFEEFVKKTLPDALDCFLIDNEGVHIIPGRVIEKFGQFTYTVKYGDNYNFYDFYIESYCETISSHRGELGGLVLEVKNLLSKKCYSIN